MGFIVKPIPMLALTKTLEKVGLWILNKYNW
jgi:hypothetical protein